MSGLVGYGSSDEEDDIRPEKPAKILKLDTSAAKPTNIASGAHPMISHDDPTISKEEVFEADTSVKAVSATEPHLTEPPSGGPAPILAGAELPTVEPSTDDASFSPYTFERQRLRELTMPTVPNFYIPDSPSPPPANSEEAATLAARTKKFERFLELKKQGLHFNDRLQSSSSLRNPSLLPKLMDFAGISVEASYSSTLSDDLGVPTRWPEEVYVERLMKSVERRDKTIRAERDKVSFVPAASKSAASSERSTPSARDGDHKKGRSDRR